MGIMSTDQPTARRPYMPDYGVQDAGEGSGLLAWSWASAQLARCHDYWLATTWPDGRPHVMPVWGVWQEGGFWFNSGPRSRKVRNLAADGRCVVTTDTPRDPVVVEGIAEVVKDLPRIAAFTTWVNAKYEEALSVDAVAANTTFNMRPVWAFALAERDFTGSPTRWDFEH